MVQWVARGSRRFPVEVLLIFERGRRCSEMPMTVDDALRGPARGNAHAVLAFADAQGALCRDEVRTYVREVCQ
jgi:hypothetical protein